MPWRRSVRTAPRAPADRSRPWRRTPATSSTCRRTSTCGSAATRTPTTQNVKAVAADEGYITTCSAQGIYPLGYYPHNIHFMVWSAMFEGRSAETLEMARKVASKIPDHIDEDNWGAYELFRSQPLYAMVRFGMWDEVLAEPQPIEKATFMTGVWHYARALAFLHDRCQPSQGQVASCASYAACATRWPTRAAAG